MQPCSSVYTMKLKVGRPGLTIFHPSLCTNVQSGDVWLWQAYCSLYTDNSSSMHKNYWLDWTRMPGHKRLKVPFQDIAGCDWLPHEAKYLWQLGWSIASDGGHSPPRYQMVHPLKFPDPKALGPIDVSVCINHASASCFMAEEDMTAWNGRFTIQSISQKGINFLVSLPRYCLHSQAARQCPRTRQTRYQHVPCKYQLNYNEFARINKCHGNIGDHF